jgi:hypothetical protein
MPLVAKIEIDYITGQQLFHAPGNRFPAGLQEQMKVLCEAPDYVKLRVWTSVYPLISAPQLSNSLHIIHGSWQAY